MTMNYLAWLLAAVLLTGCSTFVTELEDKERYEQVSGIDKHSSYPAVRRESFERINLLEMIDPENNAEKKFADNWAWTKFDPAKASPEERHNAMGAKYDLVLALFRQRTDISSAEKKRRRNSIQERMLSVSVSRCNVFKTFLRRDQVDKNFLLGTATTVSAVLGALVPSADSARSWSAVAGLFSGVRAEYNQAYYASLAAHVIVKGITTRQEDVYRRIQREGQDKPIDAYPLEAAIKDAVFFDGLCSVVAGLEQASASVDMTNEPGVDAAMRTVLRARLLKEAADMPREELLKPETLEKLGQAGTSLGMSLVGSARGKQEPEPDLFVMAKQLNEEIGTKVDAVALNIEKEVMARKVDALGKLAPSIGADAAAQVSPKVGEIRGEARRALWKDVNAAYALDGCYSKLAASADAARISSAKKISDAKTDDEKNQADLDFSQANKDIDQARENLKMKARNVLADIDAHGAQWIKDIRSVATDKAKDKDEVAKILLGAIKSPKTSFAPVWGGIPPCK